MEIGQHFPIPIIYRFRKHINILIKYNIRAYISMTSPLQYPNAPSLIRFVCWEWVSDAYRLSFQVD